MGGQVARAIALVSALLLAVGSFTILSPIGSRAGVYLADRNIGLGVLLIVLLAVRWTRSLGAVLMATAAMHLVDGVGDLALGNLPAAGGSIVVGIASAVAARWLLQEPGP